MDILADMILISPPHWSTQSKPVIIFLIRVIYSSLLLLLNLITALGELGEPVQLPTRVVVL